ncbi:MAG TPA: hypothetical protein VK797_23180 [Tepidisphaeraceae bacterium]|jgi:hypothetical protein|nr:hypothetical protein [Tepidisphaeraceae bacterium]
MPLRFQYQSLAEPLSELGESVRVDKWIGYGPHWLIPPARIPTSAIPWLSEPLSESAESWRIDKWLGSKPDRLNPFPRLPIECQTGATAVQWAALITTVDRWLGHSPAVLPRFIPGPIEAQTGLSAPLHPGNWLAALAIGQWASSQPVAPPLLPKINTWGAAVAPATFSPLSESGLERSLCPFVSPPIWLPPRLPVECQTGSIAPLSGALSGSTATVAQWGFQDPIAPPAARLPAACAPSLFLPTLGTPPSASIDGWQGSSPSINYSRTRLPAEVQTGAIEALPVVDALGWRGVQPSSSIQPTRLPVECQSGEVAPLAGALEQSAITLAQWNFQQPVFPASPRPGVPASLITYPVWPNVESTSVDRWFGSAPHRLNAAPRLPVECQSGETQAPIGALSGSPVLTQWAFEFPGAMPGLTLPSGAWPMFFAPVWIGPHVTPGGLVFPVVSYRTGVFGPNCNNVFGPLA